MELRSRLSEEPICKVWRREIFPFWNKVRSHNNVEKRLWCLKTRLLAAVSLSVFPLTGNNSCCSYFSQDLSIFNRRTRVDFSRQDDFRLERRRECIQSRAHEGQMFIFKDLWRVLYLLEANREERAVYATMKFLDFSWESGWCQCLISFLWLRTLKMQNRCLPEAGS